MYRKIKLLIVVPILINLSVLAQSGSGVITKVMSDYVLIDTDQGIGNIGEVVNIQRKIENELMTVGQVKILKFQDGFSAGKIVSKNDVLQIRVGDFVENSLREENEMINSLFSTNQTVIAKKDNRDQNKNPCQDQKYLSLKMKKLDEMTEREYQYFIKKDNECTEYQKLSMKMQPVDKNAESLDTIAKTYKTYMTYIIFSAILGVFIYFISTQEYP